MNLEYRPFFWLIWRDIRSLVKDFKANLVDVILWPLGVIFVSGYIMPYLGVPSNFGAFILSGTLIAMCFNATGNHAGDLVTDLTGPKAIFYELALPTYSWLICLRMGIVYAIKAALINVFIFPIGMVLLWDNFDITRIAVGKALLIYCLMNILFGFFSLCVALQVKDIEGYGRFWIRWGWQLFTLAGFQFPWAIMYKALPLFAYISLANPLVYCFEGMRAATLGQEGFINFWVCFGMTSFFAALFAYGSLYLFRKRLDCV